MRAYVCVMYRCASFSQCLSSSSVVLTTPCLFHLFPSVFCTTSLSLRSTLPYLSLFLSLYLSLFLQHVDIAVEQAILFIDTSLGAESSGHGFKVPDLTFIYVTLRCFDWIIRMFLFEHASTFLFSFLFYLPIPPPSLTFLLFFSSSSLFFLSSLSHLPISSRFSSFLFSIGHQADTTGSSSIRCYHRVGRLVGHNGR